MLAREDLKHVLREERSSEIKPLQPYFFKSAEEYVRDIENEIREIGNPHSLESKMLSDELQSALTDIDIIFMQRIRKITSLATALAFAQNQKPISPANLTEKERILFDLFYSSIKEMHTEVLGPIHDPTEKVNEELKKEDE